MPIQIQKRIHGSQTKSSLTKTSRADQITIFKTYYGKRVFSYNGSRLWKVLPARILSEEDVDKFKTSVKTILFEGCSELKKKAFKYVT